MKQSADVEIRIDGDSYVACIELQRPPNNFFDITAIRAIADAIEDLDEDRRCRAIVLQSLGKHFCAGRDFRTPRLPGDEPGPLYEEALRMFRKSKPIVAAVQGAAIGGGLGLAMVADFRVASPETRFGATFARLGYFPGFGLTATLPHVVGAQEALKILYEGRTVLGTQALDVGLCDELVPSSEVQPAAFDLAARLASSAPMSVQSIRKVMRGELVKAVERAVAVEVEEQSRTRATEDFAEGVAATRDRREPVFRGA